MDIISGKFLFMQWMSFTVTEQALSGNIVDIARRGDLVICDLGYSVLRIFQDMNEKGIYFLSRLKYGMLLFDGKSEEPIDILKLLKGKTFVNHWSFCGKDKKLKVHWFTNPINNTFTKELTKQCHYDIRHDRIKQRNGLNCFLLSLTPMRKMRGNAL